MFYVQPYNECTSPLVTVHKNAAETKSAHNKLAFSLDPRLVGPVVHKMSANLED